MKKNKFWNLLLFFAMALPIMVACGSDDEEKHNDGSSNTTDVAVTSNVSKLGITYAHIDGFVNLNLITSSYTSQQLGIELAMNEEFKNARQAISRALEGNKLTVVIDTLSGNTKYYYRTFVRINDLNYYGEKRSFTTKDFSNITSTGDATDLTFTTAKINCTADASSEAQENKFKIGIAYSESKSQLHPDSIRYLKIVTYPLDSIKNKSYSVSISRLQAGKTYYYCSITRAGAKYKLGKVNSFNTKSISPSLLSTGDASDITFTSAIIKSISTISSLYPKGTSMSYGVRYSTTKEDLDGSNVPPNFIFYGHDGYGDLYYNPTTGEQRYFNTGSHSVNATIDGDTFTARLNSLIPGVTYFYYAYVSVDGISLTGGIKSFTTKSGNSYLSTEDATDVTFTSAKLNGKTTLSSLYADNESNIRYYIRYSRDSNNINDPNAYYGNYDTTTPVKNGSSLYAILSNLQTNTTYYFCVVAYVDGCYICGDIKSFTTKSGADYLKTEEASDISMTSATVKGTTTLESIYGNGESIQYKILYGTKSDLASSSLIAAPEISGNTITAELTNLTIATTYYYCVCAYVDGNYVYSDAKRFTTKDIQTTGYVDLGVSCKWATCNLGATMPEDYGDYYAWGETKTREFFYTTNYSHNQDDDDIGTEISGTDYDAARVILGNPWRMPTRNEFQELLAYCFWKEIIYKNTTGYLVTGKNGNSIFLPRTGFKYGNSYDDGYYIWTSTESSYYLAYVWHGSQLTNAGKHWGLTIRPVR